MTDDLAYRVGELERRLAGLARLGTVAELDAGLARVRVTSGELTTAWLPWLTRRAGPDREWWAPEPGEQVLLLAPGGDLAQAVVLPALYQAAYPAPANAATVRRAEWADGAFWSYDRESGAYVARVQGAATVDAGGKLKLTGEAKTEVRGAAGAPVKGVVQGDCLCPFLRKPHLHLSADVLASKG